MKKRTERTKVSEVKNVVKAQFEKFPAETIESFKICGYEINELMEEKANDKKLYERLSIIIQKFSYEELKSMSYSSDKIYGIGEFILGTHEEIGITEAKYLEMLTRMIA